MLPIPKVSFIVSTRNRCETLLHTIERVRNCGLSTGEFDLFVVDNASTDGTANRVAETHPWVRLIRLKKNSGAVAKNVALPKALGQYIVFLDDDSFPEPGAIRQMMRHFEADPKLGAATFTITLPDGSNECSAYPDVFIGCGVGLRRKALRHVGGLPNDFFMQAEEYDLSLRLLNAGWRVRTFDDLHVTHLKTPQARVSSRTMRLDTRNNLYLILRRFPMRFIGPYLYDWMKRYAWIAISKNAIGPFLCGLIEGTLRSLLRPRRSAISEVAFEQFAKIKETQKRLTVHFADAPPHAGGARGRVLERDVATTRSSPPTLPSPAKGEGEKYARVILIDVGKNIYAYWRACQTLGIEIVAIADPKLARPSRRYRGIRLVDDETARALPHDAAIIANLSTVQARDRRSAWRATHDRPVIDLFDENPGEIASSARFTPSPSRLSI